MRLVQRTTSEVLGTTTPKIRRRRTSFQFHVADIRLRPSFPNPTPTRTHFRSTNRSPSDRCASWMPWKSWSNNGKPMSLQFGPVGKQPLELENVNAQVYRNFWIWSNQLGSWVVTPSLVPLNPPPPVCIDPPPRKNSQNKSKIHCWPPLWFSHKSITGSNCNHF